MKTTLKIITLILFIGLIAIKSKGGTFRSEGGVKAEPSAFKAAPLQIKVDGIVYLDLSIENKEKTIYYVKVGNTISKLEDKEGYIIAAKRLGMETIQIIPDGKVYRTVSLDLKKDDESLKDAIEVKIEDIIVAN